MFFVSKQKHKQNITELKYEVDYLKERVRSLERKYYLLTSFLNVTEVTTPQVTNLCVKEKG